MVYKYKDKHTNERLKSVRTLKKIRNTPYEEHTEYNEDLNSQMKKTGKFTLISPQDVKSKDKFKAISPDSEYDSKLAPADKSLHLKEVTSGYPYNKENSEDVQGNDQESELGTQEPFDMVNLQNEAFSKMFVETPSIPQKSQSGIENNNEIVK